MLACGCLFRSQRLMPLLQGGAMISQRRGLLDAAIFAFGHQVDLKGATLSCLASQAFEKSSLIRAESLGDAISHNLTS